MKPASNRKAQTASIAYILLVLILLVVSFLTYIWGKGLLESQRTRATATYMTAKLLEIKTNVLEVAHEGLNSTRIVRIDIPEGTFYIYNGSHCAGNSVGQNGLAFNISSKEPLINSESWISIDPIEGNTSCSANYENNSGPVLMGIGTRTASAYQNSYYLWFRNITQLNGATSNNYILNITPGANSRISGSGHTLIVRNDGVTNSSFNIYTRIIVDIA